VARELKWQEVDNNLWAYARMGEITQIKVYPPVQPRISPDKLAQSPSVRHREEPSLACMQEFSTREKGQSLDAYLALPRHMYSY